MRRHTPARPFRSVLVYGDADFSYSFDLARYSSTLTTGSGPPRLVATAYDALPVASAKYASLPYASKVEKLRTLSKKQSKKRKRSSGAPVRKPVDVKVLMGVDALDPLRTLGSDAPATPEEGFDTVIFNHPHLGKEDFRAHARFLAHFFAAVKGVLTEGGR